MIANLRRHRAGGLSVSQQMGTLLHAIVIGNELAEGLFDGAPKNLAVHCLFSFGEQNRCRLMALAVAHRWVDFDGYFAAAYHVLNSSLQIQDAFE